MKKVVTLMLFLFLFAGSLVFAEEETKTIGEGLSDAAKGVGQELGGENQEKTKEIKKLELPGFLRGPAGFVFALDKSERFNEEDLSLEAFLVFCMVFFMLFLIVYETIDMIGISQNKIISGVIAFSMILVGSIFGSLVGLTNFYFNLAGEAGVLANWSVWAWFLEHKILGTIFFIPLIVIGFIIWLIFDWLKTYFGRRVKLDTAKNRAFTLGLGLRRLKKQAEMLNAENN